MAKIAQKRVEAGYYPSANLFATYTHYNSPTNLRPLDPLATGALIAHNEPLGFAQTIQKIGISATVPLFIKELGSLSQRAKYLAKSAKLKKSLNFYQNEALILGANATLQYLDNLLLSLKSTQNSLLKTKKDIKIAVESGRTPAIAIDKIDERLNQIDISINSIEIKKATLVSSIENLTGIELKNPVKMKLVSKIKRGEIFALKPLQELVKASLSDYKATKQKRYYPKVALNLMWSENYAQNDVNTKGSVNLGYGYYQLGVSMPLYNRGEDVDMQLKKIAIMKDKMKLKKSEQELKSEAKALQKSLILLEKSKKLKKLNIERRENLLKYAKVAYAQGSMTEEDYLVYEDGVLSAKSSYFETLSQSWQTLAKLAVIYGNDLREIVE
jgi:outer membrane protein TolC